MRRKAWIMIIYFVIGLVVGLALAIVYYELEVRSRDLKAEKRHKDEIIRLEANYNLNLEAFRVETWGILDRHFKDTARFLARKVAAGDNNFPEGSPQGE